jgi:hypothetical protein
MAALDVVYEKCAPEVRVYGRIPRYELPADDPFPLHGPFSLVDAKTYLSERRATGEAWAGFAGTISDHQRLPGGRLALLRAAIRKAVGPFGETLRVRLATTAVFARRT